MRKKELAARVEALEAEVATLRRQVGPKPTVITISGDQVPEQTAQFARSVQRELLRLKRSRGGQGLGLA